METGWTDSRVDLLKKLWLEGLSASQIAGILGGGATRNSVIGKARRLKLPMRAAPTKGVNARPPRYRTNRADRVPSVPARVPRASIAADIEPTPYIDPDDGADCTGLIGLLQLNEHTCKYPYGDPLTKDFGFCGKPSRDGSPYCDDHHRRTHGGVWQP